MSSTSDLTLPRRIERTDAASVFVWAEALRRLNPELEIAAEEHCGGCALFAGVGSPYTHAMGTGMSGPVTDDAFDEMEQFFRSRGSAVLIDLCPLADAAMLEQVVRRGYRVIEFNNLLVRSITSDDNYPEPTPGEQLLRVNSATAPVWAQTVARGFAGTDDPPLSFTDALGLTPHFMPSVLSLSHGEPAAGAGMNVEQNAALFCGDATRMRFRGQGMQSRLIRYRLAWAHEMGCDLAYATVIPGSQSHKNYEREGFRLLYMRVNVAKD